MSHREVGAKFVAAARPGFRKFEQDRDKVGTAIVKAMKAGHLDRDTAGHAWIDRDHCLSLPLQDRYVQSGAWDSLIAFHRRQLKRLGRNSPWPDSLAIAALEAMTANGLAASATAIGLAYCDMQLKRLRQDIRTRNRRGPRRDLDAATKRMLEAIGQAIADAIPDRKRELLNALDALESRLGNHWSEDERSAFEAIRREIWQERRS